MSFSREVYDFDFEQHVLKSTAPVVVLFYTSTCGPCKEALPQVNLLGQANPNLNAVYINTDKGHQQAKAAGVHAHPTWMIFKDGASIATYIGYTQLSRMQAWIENTLGLPRTDPSVHVYG